MLTPKEDPMFCSTVVKPYITQDKKTENQTDDSSSVVPKKQETNESPVHRYAQETNSQDLLSKIPATWVQWLHERKCVQVANSFQPDRQSYMRVWFR